MVSIVSVHFRLDLSWVVCMLHDRVWWRPENLGVWFGVVSEESVLKDLEETWSGDWTTDCS